MPLKSHRSHNTSPGWSVCPCVSEYANNVVLFGGRWSTYLHYYWAAWCTGVWCKHSGAAVSHSYQGSKSSSARTAQASTALVSLGKRHHAVPLHCTSHLAPPRTPRLESGCHVLLCQQLCCSVGSHALRLLLTGTFSFAPSRWQDSVGLRLC